MTDVNTRTGRYAPWMLLLAVLCILFSPAAHARTLKVEVVGVSPVDSAATDGSVPPRPGDFHVRVHRMDPGHVNEECTVVVHAYGNAGYDRIPAPGDRVLVDVDDSSGGMELSWIGPHIADASPWFLLAVVCIFIAMTGRRGFGSMFGLIIPAILIYYLLFGMFRSGMGFYAAGIVCVVTFSATAVFFILPRRHFWRATAGILCGLGAIMVLNLGFYRVLNISGARTEYGPLLLSMSGRTITESDLTAMLAISGVIAAMGILLDIAVLISSVIGEIRRENPDADPAGLRKTGIELGREIFPPLFNTLLLSYAGITLPLIVVFHYLQIPLLKILNYQFVCYELMVIVSSGFGMIITVYAVSAFVAAGTAARPAFRASLLLILALAGFFMWMGDANAAPGAPELPEDSELKVHPLLEAGPDSAYFFPARVTGIEIEPNQTQRRRITVRGLTGRYAGRTCTAINEQTGGQYRDIVVDVGDFVLVRLTASAADVGGPGFYIDDYLRLLPMLAVIALFLAVYAWFCRSHAIGGILSMMVAAAFCFYVLPRGLIMFNANFPYMFLTAVIALLVALLFLFQYRLTMKNQMALAASITALLIGAVAAEIFLRWGHMQGFSVDAIRLIEFVNRTVRHPYDFNYRVIALAGIMVYAVGVVVDASVDVISGLDKLYGSAGMAEKKDLRRSGRNVVRNITIAMLGTLPFVSMGTNLMDFYLTSLMYKNDSTLLLNHEPFQFEIGRILCGTLSFLAATVLSYIIFGMVRKYSRKKSPQPRNV